MREEKVALPTMARALINQSGESMSEADVALLFFSFVAVVFARGVDRSATKAELCFFRRTFPMCSCLAAMRSHIEREIILLSCDIGVSFRYQYLSFCFKRIFNLAIELLGSSL